jgi:8-amino-7-oxononanoate synthase
VNEIGDFMRMNLRKMGYDTGNSMTPVVPVVIGEDMKAVITWKTLFEAGVYVNVVVSPAVPQGRQLLRTSYMAIHTDDQLNQVLRIFEQVGKQMGLI